MTEKGIIVIPPDPRRKGGPPIGELPMTRDGERPGIVPLPGYIMELLKDIGPFKPLMYYIPGLDWLVYLERDCSHVSQFIPGSNISLLYDTKDDQLVGMTIEGASAIMNPAALAKITRISNSPEK